MGKISKFDQNINAPVIAGVEITTDADGRFNLNALHKAGSGADKDAPAKWLRNGKAKDLIAELERETGQICTVTAEGRNGGTFVHELLAIEYAGWISPAFRLKVNQTFIDFKSGKLVAAAPALTGAPLMAAALIEAQETMNALTAQNHQQAERIAELAPEAEEYRAYISLDGVCSFEQFCNKHGVKKNHPGQLLRDKLMLQQKKLMVTLKGTRSGILKNVQDKDSFHYVDSKGNQVEAQRAYIVTAKEATLLGWLVDAYGRTAFRSLPDFARAKGLIGGAS